MTDEEAWEILCSGTPLFGLRAQGHVPLITRMLASGWGWEIIGRAIGWCPEVAERHWKKLEAK